MFSVICEVSARHYHPGKSSRKRYIKKSGLSQKRHWVTKEKVEIHGMRFGVVMPPRKEEVYEMSLTDWHMHMKGAPRFNGTFQIKLRHFHCDKRTAEKWGLRNGDRVSMYKDGPRAGRLDNVVVRIDEWSVPRVHIDTDEANALFIQNGDRVLLILPRTAVAKDVRG
jgi:propanediol utilization protein